MTKATSSIAIVVALLVAAAVAWYALRPVPSPVVPPAPAASASPDARAGAPPAVRFPIENAQGDAVKGPEPLPPLDASDAPMAAAAGEVVGGNRVERLFNLRDFARRVVATVDNLPRSRVPQRVMVMRPAEGLPVVTGTEGDFTLDERNAARYARYVEFFDQLDLARAVGVYVRFYPLLQQAYRDLGYPDGYFNDRVIAAIDDMLGTPVVTTPVKLVQPHVLYTFADPDLEARSAGQKILLRMGPANAERVKKKLRDLRQRLTGLHP